MHAKDFCAQCVGFRTNRGGWRTTQKFASPAGSALDSQPRKDAEHVPVAHLSWLGMFPLLSPRCDINLSANDPECGSNADLDGGWWESPMEGDGLCGGGCRVKLRGCVYQFRRYTAACVQDSCIEYLQSLSCDMHPVFLASSIWLV
jgi:hypothetical protein